MAKAKFAAELSEEEIAKLVAMEKFIAEDIDWKDIPNNSNYLAATDSLLDSTGASIPGLSYELQVRKGRYKNDCSYEFCIFLVKGGRRHPVYRIDAVPSAKRSHKGQDGWWRGAHEHYGNRAARFDPDVQHECDHEAWFKEFLDRANIQFSGKYLPPTSAELF